MTNHVPVDLAVVGCGYIAIAEHIPSILTSRNGRLRAVVEPRADMRALVASRFAIPVFESISAMRAASVPLQAVVICAGPLVHADLIETALSAGLHVLVEKPLCHSVTEGRRIAQAARNAARQVMVGYMRRYDDDVLTARRLLLDGSIGTVRAIHTVFKLAMGPHFARPFDSPSRGPAPPDPPVPPDLLPDDQIINQSLHQINLIRFLVGDVVGISGVQKAPSAVHLLFALAGGAIAFHGHVNGMGHGEEATIYGDHGRISLKLWSPHIPFQFPELKLFDKRSREDRLIHVSRLNPYQNEVEEFCRVVAGSGENRSPPDDAVRDLEIIAAVHRVHAQTEVPHVI